MAKKRWMLAGIFAAAGLGFVFLRSRKDDDDLDDWDMDDFPPPAGADSRKTTAVSSQATNEPDRAEVSEKSPAPDAIPAGAEAAKAAERETEPPAIADRRRDIKGNIRGDQLVYHLPGDAGYDEVIEEVMFATAEEAEAAGFRPATGQGEN